MLIKVLASGVWIWINGVRVLHYSKRGEISGDSKMNNDEKNNSERSPGTTVDGKPFDEDVIDAVWQKGESLWHMDSYKKDMFGTSICRFKYGKECKNGWVIDHIMPVEKGGTDDLSNLQPLYWENNLKKGDKILKASENDCCVSVVIE